MNDRELLKLAAKAAGVALVFDPDGISRNCTVSHPAMNIYAFPLWNPFIDDGDAFRLACKLSMDIFITPISVAVSYGEYGELVYKIPCGKENQAEIARKAIVMAAAEIGRAM